MGLLRKIIKKIAKPAINKHKGKVGERKVKAKLNHGSFGQVEHRQINALILVDDNGKSHQIDHIEIRQNGIFCIETKNYIGWILGGENQEKWTQCLNNGEKHQFTNPLKQNQSHIFHLRKVLGNQFRINSVVVMVQNNADKIGLENVVNLCDLKRYLKNYYDGTSYSAEEMDEIYSKLINAQAKMSNKEHVRNIKQTQFEIKKGICPRCGGTLIARKGRYGEFWGCSNYPECTFTLNKK